MADRCLAPRNLGALVRLDVRSQTIPRQSSGHLGQIVFESFRIDKCCWCYEIADLHSSRLSAT
jgi:hypothetical protein